MIPRPFQRRNTQNCNGVFVFKIIHKGKNMIHREIRCQITKQQHTTKKHLCKSSQNQSFKAEISSFWNEILFDMFNIRSGISASHSDQMESGRYMRIFFFIHPARLLCATAINFRSILFCLVGIFLNARKIQMDIFWWKFFFFLNTSRSYNRHFRYFCCCYCCCCKQILIFPQMIWHEFKLIQLFEHISFVAIYTLLQRWDHFFFLSFLW